jgi:hypothetical protein
MGGGYPLSSVMVVWPLDLKNDGFQPFNEGEKCLRTETAYLVAICALINLANCTRHDVPFGINLLIGFSAKPTKRHWNGVKSYPTIPHGYEGS